MFLQSLLCISLCCTQETPTRNPHNNQTYGEVSPCYSKLKTFIGRKSSVDSLMKSLWTGLVVVLLISLTANPIRPQQSSHVPVFSGTDAYQFIVDQCDFGPRPPGSDNLSLCRAMIAETFESFMWNVTFQNFTYQEVECVNIIARWNSLNNSPIILGAHYDTRPPGPSDR